MQPHRRSRALIAAALMAPSVVTLAGAAREQVEQDWQRQDEGRMREIREPGTVRFPDEVIQWEGALPATGSLVPQTATPTLDGRLDDDCWSKAAVVAPDEANRPEYRLCHDGERMYIGVSLPTEAEGQYRGSYTSQDAHGAVDGGIGGLYGFHAGSQPNPWWQVDLGDAGPLDRIVVWNRIDYAPGLHNADNLQIHASDNENDWTLIHDNKGKFFGGVKYGGPLVVDLKGLKARYLRFQIPSEQPIFLHFDEVQVFAKADPERNIAQGRPAKQSSVSTWSRGGLLGRGLIRFGGAVIGLTADEPPRVTLNDKLPGTWAASRADGRTFVEAELMLIHAVPVLGQVQLAGGANASFTLGGRWRVAWPDAPLGFGHNRLTLELEGPADIGPPVQVQVETVVFTQRGLEKAVVFQRAVRKAGPVPVEFGLRHEGPAAVIVRMTQGQIAARDCRTFYVHPVRETLQRARRLAADFELTPPEQLGQLYARLDALVSREKRDGPDPARRAELYRQARWLAREIALSPGVLGCDALLFAKRHTQQSYADVNLNHLPWGTRPGGDICILSPVRPDGEVRTLLNGVLGPGHLHGLDLSYDGERVLFGWARAQSNEPPEGWTHRPTGYDMRRNQTPTHIFELALASGAPRQITDGEWSDIDPTYLPNGRMAFVSERCGYSLECNELDKDETSCNLYVCDLDGGNVRRLSATKDGDYIPRVLNNGQIAYTRWEYQERSFAHIHSVWIMRPDGTFADALYKQHMNDPWSLEDTKAIPGSDRLVSLATGHHSLAAGSVVVLDPRTGMNNPDGLRIVTPGVPSPEGGMIGKAVVDGGVRGIGGIYMTPWALSEKAFLTSYTYGGMQDENGYALYVIDAYGGRELVYRDPDVSCSSPVPLLARPRPPVLAPQIDPPQEEATCIATNVHEGVPELEPGSIKFIRISQRLPWPYDNTYGGQRYEPDVKSVMVNWTPARVLGTVPVEPDGSAHFRVPADTPVYFQALDENQMELRRMRSFISFHPGETRGCIGCHESRGTAAPPPKGVPLAARREPSRLVPSPFGTRAISFLRDVQPVFDRHCVSCHSGMKPANGSDLSAGLTDQYNRAYETITAKALVSRSNIMEDARVTAVKAFGSHKSKLVEVVRAGHKGRVKLSDEDLLRLVVWVDANAPYHDGFINKRRQPQPYNLAGDQELAGKIAALHAKGCAQCHEPAQVSRLDWIDIHKPERSTFLRAPLAKQAGGTAKCKEAVYGDTTDEGYQAVLKLVTDAARQAWERPRRDLRAFLPDPAQRHASR